jgi:Glutathione S-transferase, N-terminal domain
MKLYEFPPTRSIRPRWMLQELEVPFESIRVDLPKGEHRSPAFLKLNPAAKVPVLVDGDLVLNESVWKSNRSASGSTILPKFVNISGSLRRSRRTGRGCVTIVTRLCPTPREI